LTSMVISSPERRTTVAMIAPRLIIYRGLEHTPRNNILSRPHPSLSGQQSDAPHNRLSGHHLKKSRTLMFSERTLTGNQRPLYSAS
ncbi:hypothetical protein, partial [Rhabdochromatium marinum]|uniref:hypothetical protein n=1 Tax=Rhabdochromatium marinum TaxID=48729 RepID=UPI001A922BAF